MIENERPSQEIEAKNEDEAYLRVLEGLPNDETRGVADIEIW